MRRLLLSAAAAALVLSVSACSANTRRGVAPTTVAPRSNGNTASRWPTSEDQLQIERDIATKGLTPQRALMLFSIEVGALPGVPAHTGRVDSHEFDGSQAVTDLYAVWKQLTPAQRQAAARLLSGTTLTKSASALAKGTSPLAQGSRGTTTTQRSVPPTTVAWHNGDPVRATPVALAGNVPTWDYFELAVEANTAESAKLGLLPIPKWAISIVYGTPPGKAWAETITWADDGTPFDDGCHITIWDGHWNGISDWQAQAVIDHEMFHCYEQRAVGNLAQYATVHQWLTDGESDWVMAVLAPLGAGVLNDYWHTYITTPSTPYWARTYDAVGVFGHFGDVVGQDNVWPSLLPAIVAGVGNNNTAALTTLTGGVTSQFFASWGPSYFEETGRHDWSTQGPANAPTAGPAPTSISLGNGDGKSLTPAAEGTVSLTTIDASADVVVVYPDSGYGMLHDADHTLDFALDTSSGPIGLCLKDGGCKCPDGSPGASDVTSPAKGPITIGLAGGDQSATGAVSGVSLDQFCKEPDPPQANQPAQPGGGGGGGGGGGEPPGKQPDLPPEPTGESKGDPHLQTYDGERYEFQTVGEFTLTRSTSGDFEVQQRNTAIKDSRQAAANQAVAVRVGSSRIEWSVESGRSVRRIDGAVVTTPPAKVGSATLSTHPTLFGPNDTLTLADGTIVRVGAMSDFGFNVEVVPSAKRRGELEGLLGNADGKKGDDLVAAGGRQIPVTGTTDQLDHTLADHWRVTAASSLFWYPKGRSTEDYTDAKFPYPGQPANLAEAKQACADQGITDAGLLQNCITDFAATSSPLFASLYGYGQAVDRAKAAHKGAGPATPDRSIRVSGTITRSNLAAEQKKLTMDITVKAGDVVRLTDPSCQDVTGSMWLYFPARRNLPAVGAQVCGIERIQFPDAGTYHVHGSINPGTVGHYDFTIRWIRPDRVEKAHYGETLSGTIPGPGEHDVYWFDGKAGDKVKTWGTGCSNPRALNVGIWDTRNVQLSFGNPCNNQMLYTLEKSGRYQLVVNVADNDAGSYAFVLQK